MPMSKITEPTTIANIPFQRSSPTRLPMRDLSNWVIWQFPHVKGGSFLGAVHPPLPGPTWYPALIQKGGKQIQVFAHLGMHFATPEEALSYLQTSQPV